MVLPKIVRFLILLTGIFIIAVGCSDSPDSSSNTHDVVLDSITPDQVTSKARIFLYNGGIKTTDLHAEQLRQFSKLDSTIAFDLDVDFFDSTGVKISNLKADSGYIREKNNFLSVTGNVVVIGKDSVMVFTEYLEWDAANEMVNTDSFVVVIRDNDTLTSYGMITDPKLENITFKRQVQTRISDIERVTNNEDE